MILFDSNLMAATGLNNKQVKNDVIFCSLSLVPFLGELVEPVLGIGKGKLFYKLLYNLSYVRK